MKTYLLCPLIPQSLNLPSAEKLEVLNQELTKQIQEKEAAEQEIRLLNTQLEQRVEQRTSELVLAIKDLQKQTRFNEKITELAPNIIYIYDLKTQQNYYCNPFIGELLGYSPREIKNLGMMLPSGIIP